MTTILTPKVRSWLYGVVTAALAILVVYGVISEGEVSVWLALAGALLGVVSSGTATAYRPTRVPADAPDVEQDLDTPEVRRGRHAREI